MSEPWTIIASTRDKLALPKVLAFRSSKSWFPERLAGEHLTAFRYFVSRLGQGQAVPSMGNIRNRGKWSPWLRHRLSGPAWSIYFSCQSLELPNVSVYGPDPRDIEVR